MSQRGIDAAAESAPVAVVVWCDTCGHRKRLGEVRRSSAGLVFDALLPGSIGWAPGQREALLEGFHKRGAKRLPLPVAVGRCIVLLDDQDDRDADTPAVECSGHRIDLTRAELVEAAERQTHLKKPANIGVHH